MHLLAHEAVRVNAHPVALFVGPWPARVALGVVFDHNCLRAPVATVGHVKTVVMKRCAYMWSLLRQMGRRCGLLTEKDRQLAFPFTRFL